MTGAKEIFEQEREYEMLDIITPPRPVSRLTIAQEANRAVSLILETGNPIGIAEKLSAMKEFIEKVQKDPRLVAYVREELEKYKGTKQTEFGTKLECAEVGTKYDYSQCGDGALDEFEAALVSAEGMLKDRQEFLKRVPKEGIEVVYRDEVQKIYPPAKSSTSSFKVTLAK